MRVREMMSAQPIIAHGHQTPAEAESLMRVAGITHLPVVDGARLTGIWLARGCDPPALLGPDRVFETRPDADAAEAMCALVGDVEAVLVWDSGVPAGLLTRTDVMVVLRSAIGRGIGRRHPEPLLARIFGPSGEQVTEIIARTIRMLGRLDVGLVPADQAGGSRDFPGRLGSLGDAQIVLVEADSPAVGRNRTDAEIDVIVVPADDLGGLAPEQLAAADALLVTSRGLAEPEDLDARLGEIRAGSPALVAFVVGDGSDDPGLAAWARWVEARALLRRS